MQGQHLDKTAKSALIPRKRNTGHLYDIVYEAGGSVPKELAGAYTGAKQAIKAIEDYKSLLQYEQASKKPIHRSRSWQPKQNLKSVPLAED